MKKNVFILIILCVIIVTAPAGWAQVAITTNGNGGLVTLDDMNPIDPLRIY